MPPPRTCKHWRRKDHGVYLKSPHFGSETHRRLLQRRSMMFVADDLGSLILKDVSGGSFTVAQI